VSVFVAVDRSVCIYICVCMYVFVACMRVTEAGTFKLVRQEVKCLLDSQMSRSKLPFGSHKCREVKCLWMSQMSRSKVPFGCHKCREVKCLLDVTNVEK
jgi:hypothetical protein